MSNKRGKTEFYLHIDDSPFLDGVPKDLGPFKVIGKPAIDAVDEFSPFSTEAVTLAAASSDDVLTDEKFKDMIDTARQLITESDAIKKQVASIDPVSDVLRQWAAGLSSLMDRAKEIKSAFTADIVVKERVTCRVKRGPGRGRLRCRHVVTLHAENAYPVTIPLHLHPNKEIHSVPVTMTFNCTIRKPGPVLSPSIDKETDSE